ncbi:MAG: hypothetical protein EBU93_04160 [Chlamydiae bacterium]|jgi:hypothetical protein|nr:hypothetical protein [Chlamydiota bacterium]
MSYSLDFNQELKVSLPTQFYHAFYKFIESYQYFHVFSYFFLFTLLILTILLSNIAPKSIPHGISIAASIVSLFSYLTIRQFIEAKKYSQIAQLIESTYRQNFSDEKSYSSLEIDQFYKHLHTMLIYQAKEKFFSKLSSNFFDKLKMGAYYKFYLFTLNLLNQERLLQLLKLIERSPNDLRFHTEYTNALLDRIEQNTLPEKYRGLFLSSHLKKLETDELKKRIKKLYLVTLEELKILNQLAPFDPWTHAKMAECYHGLGEHNQELQTVEILKKLRPQDKEIIFKLGELYFINKRYFEGIQIFEELLPLDRSLCEQLMAHYRLSQEEMISL